VFVKVTVSPCASRVQTVSPVTMTPEGYVVPGTADPV
jgi:hypothetical protein